MDSGIMFVDSNLLSQATVCMFMGGNVIAWTSPIQIKMLNGETHLQCSRDDWSWAVSLVTFSCVPWSIFAGKCVDAFGRKTTLLLAGPFYLLSWIITYYAHSCYVLFGARIFGGAGVAIASVVCPLYIGEIAEKEIRGRIGILISFMFNAGVVFSLAVGPFIPYDTFNLILMSFPIIFFITFYWMPESPIYQLKQNRKLDAMKSLLKLRGIADQTYLSKEFNEMEINTTTEMTNKTSCFELINTSLSRRALFVVLGIKTIQQFSGLTPIQSYMQKIFENTGSSIPSSIAGLICGVMQMIGGIFSTIFVDKFGRKPLLLVSSIGTSISLFAVGLYFYLQNILQSDTSFISWLPLVSIMGLMILLPIGVSSLSYVYLGELFPTNLKGNAAIVAVMYSAFSAFIMTKLFDIITIQIDIFAPFWICFVCMVIGIIFIIFYVPETKGKTLIEIQSDLKRLIKTKSKQIVLDL